jgi:hypothetical protein
MTDPGDEPTPTRGKRRRWIVLVLIVLIGAVSWLWFGPRSSVVARAALIKVGQPRDEVIRLLGTPQMSSTVVGRTPTEGYSDMSMVELSIRILIEQYLGFDSLPIENLFPVEIEYDANRRVSRVIIQTSDD